MHVGRWRQTPYHRTRVRYLSSAPTHSAARQKPRCYNPRVSGHLSAENWDSYLAAYPDAHLLQMSAWGALKARFGWTVERIQGEKAGAQVLFRRLALGLTLAYIPKGPIGEWLPGLLPDLDALCRARGAFALKVEPDGECDPALEAALLARGFRHSPHPIQPGRTLLVPLNGDEEDILARMAQKTRYNIHLAERKGVRVRPWDDLDAFGRMMQVTAERDAFAIHAPGYYRMVYDLFHALGACELLVAEAEGVPLAALMAFARGRRAWYFYGASTNLERSRMPTYLLQWEAMRWARRSGGTSYDLWGVPDADLQALEANFTRRQDGLWPVYRFKRGFGGRLVRSAGAWDRVYHRPAYLLYRAALALRRLE